MTIKNTYAAESWDKVYSAFQQINFTSFDFDTVKASLLQYLQIYHAEDYNDFIESSELIALLELFAYSAELMAYRVDLASHENFITTAQRKQSVLRLAKLISYTASRNIPARGLVKINSIRTDQTVYDSLGNNLAGVTVLWNDPNNSNWKEQFFLVMNLSLTTSFGQPTKSFQVADVLMQLYTFNNLTSSFTNGVSPFTTSGNTSLQMEVVPVDIDANGPFERSPSTTAQFNLLYASDGRGDGSDYTGFLMFVKQGTLLRTDYIIPQPIANRSITLDAINVNNTDVWVYEVDSNGAILANWVAVDSLTDSTLAFNTNTSTANKYEIETLENDRISLLFGDGNFSNIPVGNFQLWTRTSVNQAVTIPKSSINAQAMSFTYQDQTLVQHQFNLSFSLTSSLQNNAASETIEHIRQSAPSTYYSQNRMVNGQDYNTFMLRDSSILKLNTINRTFAGQPKYIEWNDASGAYQNIKLFGDDLTLQLVTSADMVQTTTSSKGLISSFIEPLLQTNALLNVLTHVLATATDSYGIISYPRRKFIEDNQSIYKDIDGNFVNPYGKQLSGTNLQTPTGSLTEKTMIQGALDQHWYGEPLSTVTINGTLHGVIPDPVLFPASTGKLYISDLPRTIDGVNTYPPGDTGSGLQPIQPQPYFGLKFNRFLSCFGSGDITLYNPLDGTNTAYGFGDTVSPVPGGTSQAVAPAQGLPGYKYKVETLTIEKTSDSSTFTVISNLRGKLPDYNVALGTRWSNQVANSEALPCDFLIPAGTTAYEAGDAFVIDISYRAWNTTLATLSWGAVIRTFGTTIKPHKCNLSGWWELVPSDVITAATTATPNPGAGLFSGGPADGPNFVQQQLFDQTTAANSWVFLVARTDNPDRTVASWSIYNRDMKLIATSPTTKFWYNQSTQITDPTTLKPLYDKIRVLRSNLDELGQPLKRADVYDVVGFVYDSNGEIVTNSLEVLPTDTINFIQAGDSTPDNILQFESFAQGSYQFTVINVSNPTHPTVVGTVPCSSYSFVTGFDQAPFDLNSYDSGVITIAGYSAPFNFSPGNFLSDGIVDGQYKLSRQLYVPAPAANDPVTGNFGCNLTTGLDFMWQHYTPQSNLVDPSVSNIHDAFILTQGYYNSVINYVNGITNIEPAPDTPLELVTSYGYLLENKMLSDTLVLHPGKIKLLFGALADQTVRAKFRVIIAPTATLSAEAIKQQVINVINTYFDISNWEFGDTFYATALLALIHQALPTQISSVVLVPTYSVNSFGSLFTINSGFDEVLQSAATVSDVEIVTSLSPTVLRQVV